MDVVCSTSSDGKNTKRLFETPSLIRSVSVTADGARVLCHVSAKDPSDPSKPESQLVLMDRNGKILKTIDLASLDLRVYGTPVLLPDKTRIGMTVCQLTDRSLLHDAPPLPSPSSQSTSPEQRSDRHAALKQWEAGAFPSPPFIATIDLEGKNLEKIGPGAMASWSPDGQTVLYTELTMPNPVGGPKGCRLSIMDADGHSSRSIGPPESCDGAFSRDGKKIAFIQLAADGNSEVFVCDASGANSRKISSDATVYASPRWLPDGSSVEVTLHKGEEPVGQGWRQPDCVWVLRENGAPPRQVSPKVPDDTASLIDDDVRTLMTKLVRLNSKLAEGQNAPPDVLIDNGGKPIEGSKIQTVPRNHTATSFIAFPGRSGLGDSDGAARKHSRVHRHEGISAGRGGPSQANAGWPLAAAKRIHHDRPWWREICRSRGVNPDQQVGFDSHPRSPG